MMDTPKVLIIDDDESVYDIVETALSAVNITCIFAISAETGIEIAREYHPHLILMDLLLPTGMKGWEAISVLKADQSTRHIPIIAFTASSGHYIKQAMQAGASDFIIKPFSVKQFQRTITQHIGAAQR